MAKKRPKKTATKKSSRKKSVGSRRKKKAVAKKSTRAKKRSSAGKKPAKKKGAAATNTPKEEVQPLRPGPGEMILRMYRQGLGDCFLLAFGTRRRSEPRYVLIDCGVHMRQRAGRKRLLQVMNHLAATTGSHIHTVVATHEHADHLSGFVQKDSPFLKHSLTIGQLWVAWTEKFGVADADPDAERLRKEKARAREVIERAVEEAQAKNNPTLAAFADELRGLMDFEVPQAGPLTDNDRNELIAAINGFVGEDPNRKARLEGFTSGFLSNELGLAAAGRKPSSNELALGLLTAKAESVEYFVPGTTATIANVDSVRAYVLGPPKDELFLKKDLPSKVRGGGEHDYKETYLSASVELQALSLAPALDVSDGSHRAADQKHPFAYEYRRCLQGKETRPSDLWGESMKGDESTSDFFKKSYFDGENEWRRIDGDWLAPAGQLALQLDSDTNNTSLTLAFELGHPGSGPVLLFPGDAQVGNWLSWREQQYTSGGITVTADDLLRRTLVYKCGHHASHNATLKNYVRPRSNDEGEEYGLELMNDIIALIPVDRDAADRPMPKPWRMPHGPLYKRLRAKSDRRVLRADLSTKPLSVSAARDHYPKATGWAPVPNKPSLSWRRSVEEFENGTQGPLYYDIRIPIGRDDDA